MSGGAAPALLHVEVPSPVGALEGLLSPARDAKGGAVVGFDGDFPAPVATALRSGRRKAWREESTWRSRTR